MLAAAVLAFGFQDMHRPRTDPPGGQTETILSINLVKGTSFDSRGANAYQELGRNSYAGSVQVNRVGTFAWRLEPGSTWKGITTKKFEGDCTWEYKKSVPNTAIKKYWKVRLDVLGHVDEGGRLIRWESLVREIEDGIAERRTSVTADIDHDNGRIATQKILNGVPEPPMEIVPNRLSMEAFAGFLDPVLKDGLVQKKARHSAMIHPLKGTLYEFDVKVTGRFRGRYFSLPQEGYTVESTGRHGYATSFISRQGQLLAVECPNGFDASLDLGYILAERKNWGRFSIDDWEKPADNTNPDRPVFRTMVTPVLVGVPDLLVPYPLVLAN